MIPALNGCRRRGGDGNCRAFTARLVVALVLIAGANGCSRVTHSELLTREEYSSAEERRAAELSLQLVPILEQQQQGLRDQERRLQRLDRRLEVILARVNELDQPHRLALDSDLLDDEAGDGGDDSKAEDTGTDEEPEFNQAYLSNDDPLVFGAHECIAFPEQGLVLRARVDSGANTASLNATDIQEFERDGESWVRFRVGRDLEEGEDGGDDGNGEQESDADPAEVIEEVASLVDESLDSDDEESSSDEANQPGLEGDDDGDGVEVEAPVERRVTIQQASGEEQRVVVRLPIRLGSLQQRAEFTLTDRAEMSFPVLIGRRLVRDVAVIDVAREYVQPCSTDQ